MGYHKFTTRKHLFYLYKAFFKVIATLFHLIMVNWNDIPSEYKPHWSTWKIEGTPLEETQKRLSQKGLHDPWLRNEVWKYKLDIKSASPIKILSRGMKSGFLLFLGVLAAEKMIFPECYHRKY